MKAKILFDKILEKVDLEQDKKNQYYDRLQTVANVDLPDELEEILAKFETLHSEKSAVASRQIADKVFDKRKKDIDKAMGARLSEIGFTNSEIESVLSLSMEERAHKIALITDDKAKSKYNITESERLKQEAELAKRELKVLQFGDTLGEGFSAKDVYVVQWSFLSNEDKEKVRDLLRISTIQKIIHNASFDYQMMLKENCIIENVWDTMVMEQCIYPGYDYDLRFFSLAETLLRRYHLDVSKEQQGNFGDDIINDEKLIYAATDVVHLGRLRNDQRLKLIEEDTIQLGALS